ncbi:hypothetical protein [Streptomyces sp. NPDC058657]|uniref:hypothetical protein n=1 Tax=unclassified Streptomyces TaxID=2593676 RepID=UPI0036498C16
MALKKSMPISELRDLNEQSRAAAGGRDLQPTNGRGKPVPGTPNGTGGRLRP